MPYFVFKIEQPLKLAHMDTKTNYKEARGLVREHRQSPDRDPSADYRMVFAQSIAEAEKLLSTPRDERVIGED